MLAVPVAWVGTWGAAPVAARPDQREAARITRLIDWVEQQKDVRFIRNGKEYDCREAAAFLRGKLKWKLDEIVTVEDFITKVGSFSTTSGEPYSVRWTDGRKLAAGEYLRGELKRLDSAAAPASR
jgi:hypothetical protein